MHQSAIAGFREKIKANTESLDGLTANDMQARATGEVTSAKRRFTLLWLVPSNKWVNEEAKYHRSDNTDLMLFLSRASVSVNMFTMLARISTGSVRIGGGSPTVRIHRGDNISSSSRSSYRFRKRFPVLYETFIEVVGLKMASEI